MNMSTTLQTAWYVTIASCIPNAIEAGNLDELLTIPSGVPVARPLSISTTAVSQRVMLKLLASFPMAKEFLRVTYLSRAARSSAARVMTQTESHSLGAGTQCYLNHVMYNF